MEFQSTLFVETDNDTAADFVQTWLISHAENIRSGLRDIGIPDDEAIVIFSDNMGMNVPV